VIPGHSTPSQTEMVDQLMAHLIANETKVRILLTPRAGIPGIGEINDVNLEKTLTSVKRAQFYGTP
jgi:hypothetical protein